MLASHNSWSYLQPKLWLLRPFSFLAKCQSVDIKTQYTKYGVRCFDLRIRFDNRGHVIVAHGLMEYLYPDWKLRLDFMWLNKKGDCYVRVVNEVRNKYQYTENNQRYFKEFCNNLCNNYDSINFWYGKNLYNNEVDFKFNHEPSCIENHVSISKYKYLLGWWPWLYAKINNKNIRKEQYLSNNNKILMVDFVNF